MIELQTFTKKKAQQCCDVNILYAMSLNTTSNSTNLSKKLRDQFKKRLCNLLRQSIKSKGAARNLCLRNWHETHIKPILLKAY